MQEDSPGSGNHHRDKEIDLKILDFVAEHPGTKRTSIANALELKPGSLNEHVRRLLSEGFLEDGLFLTNASKKKHIKVYICIYTERRPLNTARKLGENYQHDLVADINTAFSSPEFNHLIFLENIDIIMGGDFDLIVTLRATRLEPIGNFVTGFLRAHKYIYKTKTLLAWPTNSLDFLSDEEHEVTSSD